MSSEGSTRLILWRHGQTDWNLAEKYQGQMDIHLNDTGRAQAALAAPYVASLNPDVMWRSPMSRTRETSEALLAVKPLEVFEDDRLKEINVGSWEGLSIAEMREIDPEMDLAIKEARDFRRSPEGETAAEVGERMKAVLTEIMQRHAGQTILVVGHGLALRVGIAALLGWDEAASHSLAGMNNAAVSELGEWRGRMHLLSYNVDVPALLG